MPRDAFGILNEYANPSLIEKENGVWEKAAVKNYKEKNPILEFSGCINDDDAKIMMAAIDECRKI